MIQGKNSKHAHHKNSLLCDLFNQYNSFFEARKFFTNKTPYLVGIRIFRALLSGIRQLWSWLKKKSLAFCRSNRAIHQRRRIYFSTCRSIPIHACEKIRALIETSKYRNSSVIPRSKSRKTRKWFQHDRIYIEIHIKMKNTFLAIYHYQTKWYHSLRKNWINF